MGPVREVWGRKISPSETQGYTCKDSKETKPLDREGLGCKSKVKSERYLVPSLFGPNDDPGDVYYGLYFELRVIW